MRNARFVVSVMACVGFFIIGRVCTVYPFSSFSMYAGQSGARHGNETLGCHVLASSKGTASDVTEFVHWDCEPWEEPMRRSIDQLGCPLHVNVEEKIRAHLSQGKGPDPAAEPVELIRRVWVFPENGATRISDHHIATCRAVRK